MGIASLSSHQHVLNKTMDGLRSRVDTFASVTELDVCIVEGVQAGAARRLKTGALTLGSAGSNDLILLDDKVAEEHAEITFTHSVFGVLADVSARAPGVMVNGYGLPAGEVLDAQTLPLDIALGETRVRIARPAGGAKTRRLQDAAQERLGAMRARFRGDPIIVGAALVLALLILGALAMNLLQRDRGLVVGMNVPTLVVPVSAEMNRNWASDLRAEVLAAGLGDNLRIAEPEVGLLKVSGFVPESKVADLRTVQAWFDAQADAPATVWDVARGSALGPLPRVDMVRLSAPKAVVLSTGDMVQLGDAFAGDWILEDVTRDTLVLARGGDRRTVAYRGAQR